MVIVTPSVPFKALVLPPTVSFTNSTPVVIEGLSYA